MAGARARGAEDPAEDPVAQAAHEQPPGSQVRSVAGAIASAIGVQQESNRSPTGVQRSLRCPRAGASGKLEWGTVRSRLRAWILGGCAAVVGVPSVAVAQALAAYDADR